jgi:hypothetical protein
MILIKAYLGNDARRITVDELIPFADLRAMLMKLFAVSGSGEPISPSPAPAQFWMCAPPTPSSFSSSISISISSIAQFARGGAEPVTGVRVHPRRPRSKS